MDACIWLSDSERGLKGGKESFRITSASTLYPPIHFYHSRNKKIIYFKRNKLSFQLKLKNKEIEHYTFKHKI